MSYLCISDDCSLVPVRDTNRTLKNEQSYNQQEPHEMNVNEEFIIPDYVCCVLTEDVWTIFGACALIISLFTIATLKYFKKYLAKTRYNKKNLRMKDRHINADGKYAATLIRQGGVPIGQFLKYCGSRRKVRRVDEMEFTKVVEKMSYPATISAHENKNHSKNLNQKCVPYDMNRVNLLANDIGNDYINASKVNGGEPMGRQWIVTQGPLNATIEDFWNMVWQEKSSVIVMLTQTFECIQVMCAQYWPNKLGRTEKYGDFVLTLVQEDAFAHYKIRTIKLQQKGKSFSEDRYIKQYHYLAWPAYPQRNCTTTFLQFLHRVHEKLEIHEDDETSVGPPIVHCHDGGGRSGAFLAVEANMYLLERKELIDVFGTVRWLRGQRRCLVSNVDQYRFIYDVLEDYILSGDTAIDLEDLSEHISALTSKNQNKVQNRNDHDPLKGGGNKSNFEEEYKKICSLRPRYSIGDCAAGHRKENQEKNRNPLIVPPDERRPYLTSFQSHYNSTTNNDAGDYINAIFVDGFTCAKENIVTEWPMSHTVGNFWAMIYDFDITAVVVLNPTPNAKSSLHKRNYGRFWPSTKDVQFYGSIFSLEMVGHEEVSDCYQSWELNLKKVGLFAHSDKRYVPGIESFINGMPKSTTKVVKVFEISESQWPSNSRNVPQESEAFVRFMVHVSRWKRRNLCTNTTGGLNSTKLGTNKTGENLTRPVAVVCQDGVSRAGVYCVASYCFDQVAVSRESGKKQVDIYQAVKLVKKVRPKLIAGIEEYKYCYKLIQTFVEKYRMLEKTSLVEQNSSSQLPAPPRIEIEEGTPTSSIKMEHEGSDEDNIEIELTKM